MGGCGSEETRSTMAYVLPTRRYRQRRGRTGPDSCARIDIIAALRRKQCPGYYDKDGLGTHRYGVHAAARPNLFGGFNHPPFRSVGPAMGPLSSRGLSF